MCDKAVRDELYMLKDVPFCLKTEVCKKVVEKITYFLGHVPDHFKTQEMCNKAVYIPSYNLKPIPDDCFRGLMKQEIETWDGIRSHKPCMMLFVFHHLRTQEMCNKVMCIEPYSLEFVPDYFKTQEMCNEVVRKEPYTLRYIPGHRRTQEICDEALRTIFPIFHYFCFIQKTYAVRQ